MAPPGILWTWYDDRNQVEAAIQIARVWFDFAKNGIDPWASGVPGIAERYRDVVRVRKEMKENRRHRMLGAQRAAVEVVMGAVVEGTFPARGAENFVEPIILRWRYKDAMSLILDRTRARHPSAPEPVISRRVRQAFEAIVIADEVQTAYQYLGVDLEWWSPAREPEYF